MESRGVHAVTSDARGGGRASRATGWGGVWEGGRNPPWKPQQTHTQYQQGCCLCLCNHTEFKFRYFGVLIFFFFFLKLSLKASVMMSGQVTMGQNCQKNFDF